MYASKKSVRKAQGKTKNNPKRLYVKKDRYGNILEIRRVPVKTESDKRHMENKKQKNRKRNKVARRSRKRNRRKIKGLDRCLKHL